MENEMIRKRYELSVIFQCLFKATYLYDILLPDGEYHRWLAEFELVRPA